MEVTRKKEWEKKVEVSGRGRSDEKKPLFLFKEKFEVKTKKMNKTKIVTVGIVVLFAMLAVSTASAHVTQYIDPQDSSVSGYGDTIEVKVMANITGGDNLRGGQFGIGYDQSCANVINVVWGPEILVMLSRWNAGTTCWGYGYDFIKYATLSGQETGVMEICTLTVQCNCSEYCGTGINLGCGYAGCYECPVQVLDLGNNNLYPDHTTFVNGTFTCGEAPQPVTFEKELVVGWNQISLPLYNETDMTVANIIDDSLSGSYSDLYRYDAVNNDWVLLRLEDEMQNGVGYFININAIDTWSYSGLPYNRVEVSLSEGLNCIGWTNTSASINATEENALGSITDKYNYVAQWNNAPSPKYEVYEQHAPDVFNDFWTLERGGGYWIAAKEDCTLTYQG